jgi:hypothetical protein
MFLLPCPNFISFLRTQAKANSTPTLSVIEVGVLLLGKIVAGSFGIFLTEISATIAAVSTISSSSNMLIRSPINLPSKDLDLVFPLSESTETLTHKGMV